MGNPNSLKEAKSAESEGIFTKKNLKAFTGIFTKVACIFDDIPFLLRATSESIGTILLATAGFVLFPVVMLEGALELSGAINKKDRDKKQRAIFIALAIGQITCAFLGLVSTAALLVFTAYAMAIAAGVASIGIPGMLAVISGIELTEKIVKLVYAKDGKAKAKAKQKVVYGSVFFGFSLAITTFATLSVVSGLGVLSLGIMPSAVLVGLVSAAVLIKTYELMKSRGVIDKIKNWVKKKLGRTPLPPALEHDMPDLEIAPQPQPTPALSSSGIYRVICGPDAIRPNRLVLPEQDDEIKPAKLQVPEETFDLHMFFEPSNDAAVESEPEKVVSLSMSSSS